MKKVLFIVLAAFVMTVGFSSCKTNKDSAKDKETVDMDDMDDDDEEDDDDMVTMKAAADDSAPEAKALALMENLVSDMKGASIKSIADMKALGDKVKQFQKDMEGLEAVLGEDYESSLPEKEQKELEQKMQKLSVEMITELQRIQQEATKAGIDEKELEGLFQ